MDWTKQLFRWLGSGRATVSPTPVGDGEVVELRTSPVGELLVRLVGGSAAPSYHRRRGSKGAVVAAGGGTRFVGAWGYNKGTSSLYVLIVDSTTVPSTGSPTVYEAFLVPPGGSFSYSAPEPIVCSAGLVWVASTTDTSVTPIATDDVGITVAYQ